MTTSKLPTFSRPKLPAPVNVGWTDKIHLLPNDRVAKRKMLSVLLDYSITIFATRALPGGGEVFYHTERVSVHQAILDVYDRGEPVYLFSVITGLHRTGLGSVIDSANLDELTRLLDRKRAAVPEHRYLPAGVVHSAAAGHHFG
jgi:replicative DNA helicase